MYAHQDHRIQDKYSKINCVSCSSKEYMDNEIKNIKPFTVSQKIKYLEEI